MDDKSILLRQREDGTWEEKPEPYAVIECETEEDFNYIKQRLESTRWIPVEERLPEVPEETEDDYCPEFNVMIKGAVKATALKFAPDGTWFDDFGQVYSVIAWMPLPEPYRKEEKG